MRTILMPHCLSKFLTLFLLGFGFTVLPHVSDAKVFTVTRYIEINHEMHSAYMYDENFQRLPDNPRIPNTSIYNLPNKPLWLLGFNADIVRRHESGRVHVLSHDPAYSEMNHHFVMTYSSPSRPEMDACTNRPIGAGSELTDFSMPGGYAYKMNGGALMPVAWHWENPAMVPHMEKVYLRFIITFDTSGTTYRDTHITWVGAKPCKEEFAIPPGKSTLEGPPVNAPQKLRLVAVVPHTHDHVKFIELRNNGKSLRKFIPENARTATAHDDAGAGATPLHTDKNHLPTQGLTPWTPGLHGPVLRKNDLLTAFGSFNNPHPRPIDNMAIFYLVWEPIPTR